MSDQEEKYYEAFQELSPDPYSREIQFTSKISCLDEHGGQ